MEILGVVPAAGKGSRWGGFYKELLPVANRSWMINETIRAMKVGGANKICVITNKDKISTHAQHLDKKFRNIFYVLQEGENDIYSAMKSSLMYAEDLNYFSMPDTYIELGSFKKEFQKNRKYHAQKPPFSPGSWLKSFRSWPKTTSGTIVRALLFPFATTTIILPFSSFKLFSSKTPHETPPPSSPRPEPITSPHGTTNPSSHSKESSQCSDSSPEDTKTVVPETDHQTHSSCPRCRR